jgi:hypothetical protein
VILGVEPVTRRRFAAGTRDGDGVFVPGSFVASIIQASVQPLTGEEAQTLLEGERRRTTLKVYTTSELQPVDQDDGEAGDRLVISETVADLFDVDAGVYEVRTVARQRKIIPHYRGFIVRVQEGGA